MLKGIANAFFYYLHIAMLTVPKRTLVLNYDTSHVGT
jgi:hypothetical protein